MKKLYILVHQDDPDEGELIIGVFSSRELSNRAIQTDINNSLFEKHKEDYYIYETVLDIINSI